MSDPFIIVLLIFLVMLAVAAGVFFWYRKKLRRRLAARRLLDSVFLEILMPREVTAQDKEKDPAKEEKDTIGIAEQLFTTLSHTDRRDFSTFLAGRETIAFEIVSLEKKISFIINCHRDMQDLVEKQIQAQYPSAQIMEVLPPQVILNTAGLAAAELALQSKYIFPLKTYKLMESDPLNALANSLSSSASRKPERFSWC